MTFKFRQKLEAARRRIRAVYFFDCGFASVIAIGGGRHQAEIAMIGREGMTGVPVVLGVDRSPNETIVQAEGEGHCIAAHDLDSIMRQSASLTSVLTRYAQIFALQAAHTALMNAHGNIEQRLARWLLMGHDRVDGDDLCFTHELLAIMLGVRRAGVTTSLHQLEARALISNSRARITILDRAGLEESADGLYGVPEAEFDRLFGSRSFSKYPAVGWSRSEV